MNVKIAIAVIGAFVAVKTCQHVTEKATANAKVEEEDRKATACRQAVDAALGKTADYEKTLTTSKDTPPRTLELYKTRLHDLKWAKDGLQLPRENEWNKRVRSSLICLEASAGMIGLLDPGTKAVESYEDSVRRAWKESEASNREADAAQDAMLESYRRKAVSSQTSSSTGARIDTFVMGDGQVVMCRTTVRNNARATSCQ
jgi:hypothetical protein